MILIISESGDTTTSYVCKWLAYYGSKFLRINVETPIDIICVNSEIHIIHDTKKYNISEFSSVWFRRGGFMFSSFNFDESNSRDIEREKIIKKFIIEEHTRLEEFVHYVLKNKSLQYLGNPFQTSLNKLIVLHLATSLGIDVPEFFISTINELKIDPNIDYLVKPISEIPHGKINNYYFRLLNKKYKPEFEINNLTHLQTYVHKVYEVRIFYFKGSFYNMAIISQNDKKTEVDFRNYNDDKPNRRVPINIPTSLERKITKLMKKLQMDTGSIDLIFYNDKYYFLEVNPVGQFGMVSAPCNYNIEQKIALHLIESNIEYENTI